MKRPHARGLTLIELLAALAVLALLSALSWRALDMHLRTAQATQTRQAQMATVQTALAQWQTDLDAMELNAGVQALDWDGRSLRITRRIDTADGSALQVVSWSRQLAPSAVTLSDPALSGASHHWWRWASPPLRERSAWFAAWQQASAPPLRWPEASQANSTSNAVDTPQAAIVLIALPDWQLRYFRDGAWVNPLSAADSAERPSSGLTAPVPDGIQLRLTLPAGHPLAGELVHEWLRPDLTPTRT
jgi:general secretion pathway protein J